MANTINLVEKMLPLIDEVYKKEAKSAILEAPAEFVADVRQIFDKAGARYQACELGKVDKGGGGTIALTLANRGMDVLDAGIAVLAMHSPQEVIAIQDIYSAYNLYKAFFNM